MDTHCACRSEARTVFSKQRTPAVLLSEVSKNIMQCFCGDRANGFSLPLARRTRAKSPLGLPEASLPPFGKGGKSPSGDRGGKQYSLLPPRRWRQSRLRDCYQIYRAGKARSSLITFAARQTYHFFQSPLNPPFTQGGHGVGYPLYTRGGHGVGYPLCTKGARCGVSPLHKGGTVWGIPFAQNGSV